MTKKLLFFYSLLIYLTLISNNGFSQNANDYRQTYAQAEDFFANENYTAALPLYLKLDSLEKGNHNTNFKIGVCYLSVATYKTKAIPYLEFATKNIAKSYKEGDINEKKSPLSSNYYLGRAYHLNYEFDRAIVMYKKYIDELGTDKKYAEEVHAVAHDIETCNYGKELIKSPVKVNVANLGEGVNTKYPEYSPVVSLDERVLIFTSRREGGESDNKLPNGEYFEDIFVSTYSDETNKWSKATSIGSNINSRGHEATVNLSTDGQKLLIYKDNGGNGDIEVSELKGNEWGVPKYASSPINSLAWESHASFSPDNRVLYFVSNRPGGYGGRDIYKCLKLPNGEWGQPQNLGPNINTEYDEDGIFIHQDGLQIYFSSNGHNSMGGFDIFTSSINDENGNWSQPANFGYPVNTPDDEVFLIIAADGKRAYYSSDKEGGFGEKDIYMITFPDYEPRDITIFLGTIVNNSTESIENNSIHVINTSNNDTVQSTKANSSTGKFGVNLPVGVTSKTVCIVNGQEIFNELIDVPKNGGYKVIKREIIYPKPLIAATTVPSNVTAEPSNATKTPLAESTTPSKENNAGTCNSQAATYQLFFKYNKKEIDTNADAFKSFIDALSTCINNNAKFEINIESSASTVPTKTFRNNENLANIRAKNAKAIITKALTKKGIKQSRIKFSKAATLVQGPEYKKDAVEGMATYEQYQYIKIKTMP